MIQFAAAAGVEAQFDPRSSTLTWLVWDDATRDAVVIDPVLDFDANRSETSDAPSRWIPRFA